MQDCETCPRYMDDCDGFQFESRPWGYQFNKPICPEDQIDYADMLYETQRDLLLLKELENEMLPM